MAKVAGLFFIGAAIGSVGMNFLLILVEGDVESAGYLPIAAVFWLVLMLIPTLVLWAALAVLTHFGRAIRAVATSQVFATALVGMAVLEGFMVLVSPDHSMDLSAGRGTVALLMAFALPLYVAWRLVR